MPEKRARIAEGAPNRFVKPGEFNAFVDKLEQDFDTSLAKQTADAEAKK